MSAGIATGLLALRNYCDVTTVECGVSSMPSTNPLSSSGVSMVRLVLGLMLLASACSNSEGVPRSSVGSTGPASVPSSGGSVVAAPRTLNSGSWTRDRKSVV